MKRVYSAVLTVFLAMQCLSAQAIGLSSFTEKLPSVASFRLPWNNPGFEANGEYNTEGIGLASWTGNKVADGFDAVEEGVRKGIVNYWHYPLTVPASLVLKASKFSLKHPVMLATIVGGIAAEATIRHWIQFVLLERWLSKSIAYDTGNESIGKKYFRFATWRHDTWKLGYDINQNPANVCRQLWLDINGLEDQSRIDIKHNGHSVTPGSVLWSEILQALQDEAREFEAILETLKEFSAVSSMIYQQCVEDGMVDVDTDFEPTGTSVQFLNSKNRRDFDVFEANIYATYENMSSVKKVGLNIASLRSWVYPWKTRIMTWHNKSSNLYWNMYRYYLRLRALKDTVENYMQHNASNNHAQPLWVQLFDLQSLVNRIITSHLYLPRNRDQKLVRLGEIDAIIDSVTARDKNLVDVLDPLKQKLSILSDHNVSQEDIVRMLGEVKGSLKSLANNYRNHVRN